MTGGVLLCVAVIVLGLWLLAKWRKLRGALEDRYVVWWLHRPSGVSGYGTTWMPGELVEQLVDERNCWFGATMVFRQVKAESLGVRRGWRDDD